MKKTPALSNPLVVAEHCDEVLNILGPHLGKMSHTNMDDYGEIYLGIIGCACFFESFLDDAIVRWCKVEHSNRDATLNKILSNFSEEIGKTTGLEGWNNWLKKILNINMKVIVSETWEPLEILFNLRNLLAHGRSAKFQQIYDANGRWLGFDPTSSRYKKIFDYMVRKKLINPTADHPSTKAFLKREIFIYFIDVVNDSIQKLAKDKSLSKILEAHKITHNQETATIETFNPRDFDLVEEIK